MATAVQSCFVCGVTAAPSERDVLSTQAPSAPPAVVLCECSECGGKALCVTCDVIWHGHPDRFKHNRNTSTPKTSSQEITSSNETISAESEKVYAIIVEKCETIKETDSFGLNSEGLFSKAVFQKSSSTSHCREFNCSRENPSSISNSHVQNLLNSPIPSESPDGVSTTCMEQVMTSTSSLSHSSNKNNDFSPSEFRGGILKLRLEGSESSGLGDSAMSPDLSKTSGDSPFSESLLNDSEVWRSSLCDTACPTDELNMKDSALCNKADVAACRFNCEASQKDDCINVSTARIDSGDQVSFAVENDDDEDDDEAAFLYDDAASYIIHSAGPQTDMEQTMEQPSNSHITQPFHHPPDDHRNAHMGSVIMSNPATTEPVGSASYSAFSLYSAKIWSKIGTTLLQGLGLAFRQATPTSNLTDSSPDAHLDNATNQSREASSVERCAAHGWFCDHCSFFNPCSNQSHSSLNVCEICHKTSDYPRVSPDDDRLDQWESREDLIVGEGDEWQETWDDARESTKQWQRYEEWVEEFNPTDQSNQRKCDPDNNNCSSLLLDPNVFTTHQSDEFARMQKVVEDNDLTDLEITHVIETCCTAGGAANFETGRGDVAEKLTKAPTCIEDFIITVWMPKVGDVMRGVQGEEGGSKGGVLGGEWMPRAVAGEALVECGGDVEEAVRLCAQRWGKQMERLLPYRGLLLDDGVVNHSLAVLSRFHGDVDAAETHLVKEAFLRHICAISTNRSVEEAETCHEGEELGEKRAEEGEGLDLRLDDELVDLIRDETRDYNRRVRAVVAEETLCWERASLVVKLLSAPPSDGGLASPPTYDDRGGGESTREGGGCSGVGGGGLGAGEGGSGVGEGGRVGLRDVVRAVRECRSADECRQVLQQECQACLALFPPRLIQMLNECQCKMCWDCVRAHFELVVRERSVRDLVCPFCAQPSIVGNSDQTAVYLQFLLYMLRPLLSADCHDLLSTKLRDWTLMMDPLFRWCAFTDCKSGFLIRPELFGFERVRCPNCERWMCHHCTKPWEEQHAGLACEDFGAWKQANDPEYQAGGLARHLAENGIECPECRCRYSLAKGGCMHFTCTQCRHEFCSGCRLPFKRNQCTLYSNCANLGMHCHHPRDCLYYLREKSVSDLCTLLKDHGKPYDTALPPCPPGVKLGAEREQCSVLEQHDGVGGEERCGRPAPENYAGLCELHYKEYLVEVINSHGLDPLPIMSVDDIARLLRRVDIPVPTRKRAEPAHQYRSKLTKMVCDDVPLPRRRKDQ